jgi:hypothetical protein
MKKKNLKMLATRTKSSTKTQKKRSINQDGKEIDVNTKHTAKPIEMTTVNEAKSHKSETKSKKSVKKSVWIA